MPRHDYVCPLDGQRVNDVVRSVRDGAQANPPCCPDCGRPMDWIPGIGAMDAFEPGGEFTMYDGQNRRVTVESFAQMRKLEQQSEQQARNGEGQPLRFRALHQNRSNMLDNTFGNGPAEKPSVSAKRKFGLQGAGARVSEDRAESHAYGPGVNDSNTSALK